MEVSEQPGKPGSYRCTAHLWPHFELEELAATAVWGTQQLDLYPQTKKYDGVFGIWYGKGPGVDRCSDVFKHANMAGTSKHGGVIAIAGAAGWTMTYTLYITNTSLGPDTFDVWVSGHAWPVTPTAPVGPAAAWAGPRPAMSPSDSGATPPSPRSGRSLRWTPTASTPSGTPWCRAARWTRWGCTSG